MYHSRFTINNGSATYQCRFLNSETYRKNHQANRIVVSEFATLPVPDPCQTIFDRLHIYLFRIIDVTVIASRNRKAFQRGIISYT